jgi:hypothetical protein
VELGWSEGLSGHSARKDRAIIMSDMARTEAAATEEWVLPPSTVERPVVSEELAERLVEEARVAGGR